MLQPTLRLGEAVKKAHEGVKKRSNKLLDYDQARSKARRASNDTMKQQRAGVEEQTAKKVFDQLDETLKQDLPKLYQVIDGVLNDSIEAANKLQGLLGREVADGLLYIPEPSTSGVEISEVLEKVKTLRIATQIV